MDSSSSTIGKLSVDRSNIELNYEGPIKYCRCRVKAPRWTAWTVQNPWRRFYGCSNWKVNPCGYFEWHDEPIGYRVRCVITELRAENKSLMLENRRLVDALLVEFEQVKRSKMEKSKSQMNAPNMVVVLLACAAVLIYYIYKM